MIFPCGTPVIGGHTFGQSWHLPSGERGNLRKGCGVPRFETMRSVVGKGEVGKYTGMDMGSLKTGGKAASGNGIGKMILTHRERNRALSSGPLEVHVVTPLQHESPADLFDGSVARVVQVQGGAGDSVCWRAADDLARPPFITRGGGRVADGAVLLRQWPYLGLAGSNPAFPATFTVAEITALARRKTRCHDR